MVAPTHTQITRRDLVNADTRTRLTLYSALFLDAWYTMQAPTLVSLGMQDTTSALDYKIPIPIGQSSWSKWVNGIPYRDIGELIGDVLVTDWVDGVRAEYRKLQTDSWLNHGWGMQPELMAEAGRNVPERNLVTVIEAGDTTPSIENYVDGITTSTAINVFGQAKPVDPLGRYPGVYSNKLTSTGTVALGYTDAAAPMTLPNIDRVKQHIQTVLSQNGTDYRGLKWTHTLVHPQDEMRARRYFDDQGTSNDYIDDNSDTDAARTGATGSKAFPTPNTAKQYKIQVVTSPYMSPSRAGIWYPIASTSRMTKAPWLTLEQIPANEVPLVGNFPTPPPNANPLQPGVEWILDWLDSHFYKHGIPGVCPAGFVAIAAKKSWGTTITEPWRMFECLPT
jgi:hypothetical protein